MSADWTPPAFRIGEGWDVHALVPGRPLVIGGLTLAHTHGLLGHSDADVLLHAITDALLAEALARVQAAGWRVGNVDATVVAQAPRLAPHRAAMVARIAALLGVEPDRVNVKAKTAESLGPVGQGAAIEARAVLLLVK